ncbi:MAG: hypothetical protein RRY97_06525 [Oscillibacter sp.]
MEIRKEQGETLAEAVGDEELAAINGFAKTALRPEQVYTFAVRLCDNEVDRDWERFDEAALSVLGDLFVGKSGIFDHQWSAQGQTARIYRTELVREPETKTAAGDGYAYLKGWAYLLRSEKNQALIEEIEGGIKKEVSVGCSVAKSLCSVCGAVSGSCAHVKGQSYGDKLCFAELREPTDAYEWSFVAVPAQRQAGVMKHLRQGGQGEYGEELSLLRAQAELGRNYMKSLRREVVRLALLADGQLDGGVFTGIAEKLEEPELLELKRAYGVKVDAQYPAIPQLRARGTGVNSDETVFLV